ncbi:glycosyltransferase family 2 protein [Mycetocola spongiae]|nr:glycosyltransferase family 2 protein [Mycetocola spongiae]
MTIMVRDEVDIIDSMITHHLGQGVDKFIVTDNGSTDGTTEVLQGYADTGVVDLRHDPVHRKQQSVTVTQMARDAFTLYGADWVLNADADEFWVAQDHNLTLRDAFSHIPKTLRSFVVPVIDMTGAPAESGSGIERLLYRDTRPEEQLRSIGLRAHSTHDSVHIGVADINVAQGNHYVSISSAGSPDPAFALEVYHLPWRSWDQFRHKVENAGRAYEANPELTPSPNHHGMRDYRSLKDGTLRARYIARSLSTAEIEQAESGVHPYLTPDHRLRSALVSSVPDTSFDGDTETYERTVGLSLARLDLAENAVGDLRKQLTAKEERMVQLESSLVDSREEIAGLKAETRQLQAMVEAFKSRRLIRFADSVKNRLSR